MFVIDTAISVVQLNLTVSRFLRQTDPRHDHRLNGLVSCEASGEVLPRRRYLFIFVCLFLHFILLKTKLWDGH